MIERKYQTWFAEAPLLKRVRGFVFHILLMNRTRGNEIKRVVLAVCVFISLAVATDAAGFYKCVDSDGNVTFADNPLPGAKCEFRRGVNDAISSEQQLPPPTEFSSQTALVAIPGTKVYVVPDSRVDIFFHNGWWWRLWEGRWYYSRHWSSGWVHHKKVPSFYAKIPSGWRNDYLKNGKRWEKQQIGAIQDSKPPTQREKIKPKRQTRPQKREAVKSQGQTQPQEREAPQRSKP